MLENLHFIYFFILSYLIVSLISCLKFVCPSSWHLHFIQSEFRGQLPQPYASGPLATQIIPSNMNDQNLEETSRYVRQSSSSRCRWSCRDLNWLLCFPCRWISNSVTTWWTWIRMKRLRWNRVTQPTRMSGASSLLNLSYKHPGRFKKKNADFAESQISVEQQWLK